MLRRDIHKQADAPNLLGLLRAHGKGPCCSGAADKCDEFPSPHGFAPAKDYIGRKQNITFLDRELCRSLPPHVRFGSKADIDRFIRSLEIN
jgi:hypothetical protein